MTITAATVRRVLAVLVSVYGVVASAEPALHLPVAVSAVLASFAPILLTLEHVFGVTSPVVPPASTSAKPS